MSPFSSISLAAKALAGPSAQSGILPPGLRTRNKWDKDTGYWEFIWDRAVASTAGKGLLSRKLPGVLFLNLYLFWQYLSLPLARSSSRQSKNLLTDSSSSSFFVLFCFVLREQEAILFGLQPRVFTGMQCTKIKWGTFALKNSRKKCCSKTSP